VILSIENIPSVIGIQGCNGTVRAHALKGLLERDPFALGKRYHRPSLEQYSLGYGQARKKVTQVKIDRVDEVMDSALLPGEQIAFLPVATTACRNQVLYD
jgi:hypothetical protein